MSNGKSEADVEFRTLEDSSIEPPNPDFLNVHAAFAKVLYASAVTDSTVKTPADDVEEYCGYELVWEK